MATGPKCWMASKDNASVASSCGKVQSIIELLIIACIVVDSVGERFVGHCNMIVIARGAEGNDGTAKAEALFLLLSEIYPLLSIRFALLILLELPSPHIKSIDARVEMRTSLVDEMRTNEGDSQCPKIANSAQAFGGVIEGDTPAEEYGKGRHVLRIGVRAGDTFPYIFIRICSPSLAIIAAFYPCAPPNEVRDWNRTKCIKKELSKIHIYPRKDRCNFVVST